MVWWGVWSALLPYGMMLLHVSEQLCIRSPSVAELARRTRNTIDISAGGQ